jgi:hypothetical protein
MVFKLVYYFSCGYQVIKIKDLFIPATRIR